MKILIICPSLATFASGNTCTAQRIQSHLLAKNIECVTCDVAAIIADKSECSLRRYSEYILKQNFDGVLFLHAYKSGNILLCKCKVCCDVPLLRYGVIFGGTDLNVDLHDKEKYEAMQKVLKHATFAVAFTEDLKRIGSELAPDLKILLQPQAMKIEPEIDLSDKFKCVNFADVNCNTIDTVYTFIMITGIRPVKDPMYILQSWMKWCETAKDLTLKLLILGPVLDDNYARRFFKQLEFLEQESSRYAPRPKPDKIGICEIYNWISNKEVFPIFYAPSIPRRDLSTLMSSQYVFAAVNTSESEGMSSAILESMANKLPVIARDIPGNNAVISDGETGLLFRSPEEFVKQAERLISDPEMRNRIVENAYERILDKHSVQKESTFYVELCMEHFS